MMFIKVVEDTIVVAERTAIEAKEQGNMTVYYRVQCELQSLRMQLLILKGEM